MSVDVMTQVWKCAPYDGGTLLVLLALADWADDDGEGIFPTVKKLAAKARQTPRSAQMNLKKLREDGLIVLVTEASGKRGLANEWRIDLQRLKDFHPITEYSAYGDRVKHKIVEVQNDTAESVPNVADFTPDDNQQDGRKTFTPEPETDGRNNFTGETSDGDGVKPASPTGEVCDISPAPPYIDIHHTIHHTPTIAGARANGSAEAIPAFLVRDPFEQFMTACDWHPATNRAAVKSEALACADMPVWHVLAAAAKRYAAILAEKNAKRRKDDPAPTVSAQSFIRRRMWEDFPEPAPAVRNSVAPWGGHPAGEKLLAKLGVEKFEQWLRDSHLDEFDNYVVLSTTSKLKRDYIAANFIDVLEQAFNRPVAVQ